MASMLYSESGMAWLKLLISLPNLSGSHGLLLSYILINCPFFIDSKCGDLKTLHFSAYNAITNYEAFLFLPINVDHIPTFLLFYYKKVKYAALPTPLSIIGFKNIQIVHLTRNLAHACTNKSFKENL